MINHQYIPLNQLPVGIKGRVVKLSSSGIERRRFLDLGLIPNSTVSTERKSPAGDPIAYNIRGSIIALRNEEAQRIIVEPLEG